MDKTEYEHTSAKLIELINKLRDAGATCVLDLPTVAVCGNQSAGKSSLLERTCGVELPRATGTCTKCPTEVRLEAGAGAWSCTVKLRVEFEPSGAALEKPEEAVFGTLDEDRKGDVAAAIRAAQKALLNPGKKWQRYAKVLEDAAGGSRDALAWLDEEEDEKKFTRNVVVLDIKGADVNLTLIDLPGIIQSDEHNPENKTIVRDMVLSYIKEPRTIIVAAISCKDDINNQAIVDLAREVDPEGRRTLGVLTKVDTIEAGTHAQWLPVLLGEKFRLDLGYFAVRNPSQKELDDEVSPEEATQIELSFFAGDKFWSDGALAHLKNRFGVANLRSEMSQQLVRVTREELPKMNEAVKTALKSLLALPETLSDDKPLALQKLVDELLERLREDADATRGGSASFLRATNAMAAEFRAQILLSRPHFDMRKTSGGSAAGGALTSAQVNAMDSEAASFWLDFKPPDAKVITLSDLKALAASHRVKELPGFVSYTTLERLIRDHKGSFDKHIDGFVGSVAQALEALVNERVSEVFGRFSRACGVVRDRLLQLFRDVVDEVTAELQQQKLAEKRLTFTQNDHYFIDACSKFSATLCHQHYADAINWSALEAGGVMAALAGAGISATKDDLYLLLASKNANRELFTLAAGTLAYFKVTSKRLIDAVPMTVSHRLVHGFLERARDGLHGLINEAAASAAAGGESGGDGDGDAKQAESKRRKVPSAAALLAEEPHIAERRSWLQVQQRQLLEAQRILASY